ncbi:unnamed protein product [Medioppia subpectinata]|uniref:Nuclear receptor domain-containing protein n=1 Tax=Medioppia subpectinata TaxID=1979941 RepID=A0A7R9KV12_9ACAR|nr:unnamed protein product [Medioppia subpectinata]CAG2109978.1 unnamed protein product [Medioppia subpectinata]
MSNHFNVMSCESCKSFFRRHALKNEFQCYLGGNCPTSYQNRKSCKKCRLIKCFAMGMKSVQKFKLIYSEERKRMRNALIEENRNKRKKAMFAGKQVIVFDDNSSQDLHTLNVSENISLDNEIISKEFIEGNNSNTSETAENRSELMVIPILKPISNCSISFNELEVNKFNELLNALKYLQKPTVSMGQTLVDSIFKAMPIMHSKVDTEIRDIVKMCKCLNGFNTICLSDQLVLIKYSSIEINFLRLISSFNFEDEYWTIIQNNYSNLIRLKLIKDIPAAEALNTYLLHKNFLQNMGLDWDSDHLIIDLV